MLDLNELYEVVGVVEPDTERAQAMAKRSPYKDLPFMTEDALLGMADVKAVAVETTIDQLVPTGIRCLQAGKHIHLDKPAGESLEACKELHAEAEKRGLTVQMGYMLRYNPAFEFLFKALKEGWLGEITEVNGKMGKLASPSLRDELAGYPGGGIFELACHLIDVVVTVLGKPEEVIPVGLKSRPDRDAFLDHQLAVMRYPKAIATVASNHIDRFGGQRRQFHVIGTEGMIEIRPLEPPKLRLTLSKARGEFERGAHEVTLPKSAGRYHGEFEDLAKIIRGEKKLAWDGAHDVAVHETILRASGMLDAS